MLWKAPLTDQRWSVGGPQRRAVIAENGEMIGVMDTTVLAQRVVSDHNIVRKQSTVYPENMRAM